MTQNIKLRLALAGIILVAIVAGFSEMIFSHLPNVFCAPEEDMDYAWFVPLFSLFVLWRERKGIASSIGSPSLLGAFMILPFLLVGYLGVRGLQVRFELLAFVGLLLTVSWALFGACCAKRLLFPFGCLLFCMPLASSLSLLTVSLRLFVSAAASEALSALGVEIVRYGNMITMPGVVMNGEVFGVDIANPCSGLRSICALLAIFVGYGYFCQPTWLRRGLFVLFAIPFAVIGNVVRIMSICLVAQWSPSFAIGFHHDFSPFIVFGIAIAMMIMLETVFARVFPKQERADLFGGCVSENARGFSMAGACLALLFVLPVMVAQLFAPSAEVALPPKVNVVSFDGFVRDEVEPSVAETNLLRGAEILKSRYKYHNGFYFDVSAVVSGANKNSLHRPELCLPSQGFTVLSSQTVAAAGRDWTIIRLLLNGSSAEGYFAYTFANQEGYSTSSHMARIFRDIIDRAFLARIDRWAMITVMSPVADERFFVDFILSNLGGMIE
ncbi:MAG: exosortase/archaeosortase family protein [Kiritimatiellae bacterium]|nr:exosortase/archaeosortase family protein [Kiritimatiellia bacterium]